MIIIVVPGETVENPKNLQKWRYSDIFRYFCGFSTQILLWKTEVKQECFSTSIFYPLKSLNFTFSLF